MKSTEKLPNEGKYNASIQSAHELSRTCEPVKKVTGFSASNNIKVAAGHHQTNNVKQSPQVERFKWNTSLCGSNKILATNVDGTAPPNKPKDWFIAAKSYNAKAEPAKDVRQMAPMSIATTQSGQQQIKSNADIVPSPHANHSSNVKVSATTFPSINASNGQSRPKGEQKHSTQAAASVQPKLKASGDINRATKQISSLNGNGELATELAESLQKSITNQSNLVNSPASKSNESSKTKKPTPSERKYKQKDAKSLHEKRKNGGKHSLMSAKRKHASNQIHHESLQRLPLQSNENEATPNDAEKCTSKRIDKEWHSPESYIYDDISSDTMIDCPEQTSCMQAFWFRDIPNENLLTREQRLENKRDNLRRQAFQYAQAQHFRSTILAKRRLITVTKALAKFKNERNK